MKKILAVLFILISCSIGVALAQRQSQLQIALPPCDNANDCQLRGTIEQDYLAMQNATQQFAQDERTYHQTLAAIQIANIQEDILNTQSAVITTFAPVQTNAVITNLAS